MEKEDRDETSSASRQQIGRASLRSEHAQQRQVEGRRVSPGFNDAQQAQLSDVFFQPNRRYVVRGPRGENTFSRQMELISRALIVAGVRISV